MSEYDRAAEYRRKMTARGRNKRAAERSLAGDPAAKQALAEKVAPLLLVDDDGVPRGDLH